MRDEQLPLSATTASDQLRQAFEQAREQWRVVRFRYAVGSEEEQAVWDTYRQASDAYIAMLGSR